MAKEKTPKQKAKEKAWESFSRYIRARDCIRFTGDVDNGICVTCKRPYPFKKLQAGHFIAGRTNSVLFDEEAVYSQCYGCNIRKGGEHVEYFVFMEQEVGRDKIEELRKKRHENVKYTQWDYETIRDKFDEKYQDLLAAQ